MIFKDITNLPKVLAQKKIKKLLNEASNQTCAKTRQEQILFCLKQSTKKIEKYPKKDTEIQKVLTSLYWDTLHNVPDQLPFLLPFFAKVCGNRKNDETITSINW